MALRLNLKPHERVIVGGAVLRNGPSRAQIVVENQTPILRERDILSPSAVRTPGERLYLALELGYVDGAGMASHFEAFHRLAVEIVEAAPSCAPYLARIEAELDEGRTFQALRVARELLEHERKLLDHVR